MAYDEGLAERIRGELAGTPGVTERRMFGGLAFLVDGHMAVAAGSGGLMARVDKAEADELVGRAGVRPMVMRGREMTGWLLVDASAYAGKRLGGWVRRGLDVVRTLPPK